MVAAIYVVSAQMNDTCEFTEGCRGGEPSERQGTRHDHQIGHDGLSGPDRDDEGAAARKGVVAARAWEAAMTCPHGRGPASQCSQCLGVPAQHVAQSGGLLSIDGVTARPVEPVRTPFKRRRK